MLIELNADEVELLCSALDSHRYWQLSEPEYRNSGDILNPYTNDEDDRAEIEDSDALEDKLRARLAEDIAS